MTFTPVEKLKIYFVCSGRIFVPSIVDILLRVGCGISGLNERYLKFEAYWYQYCSSKVTLQSAMTVGFTILNAEFEIDR